MNNIPQRIKEFADSKGISLRQIEISIDASNGTITKAIKNNSDIGSNWVEKIFLKYPDLNSEWLVSGIGNMFKHEMYKKTANFMKTQSAPFEKAQKLLGEKETNPREIPLIPIDAMAGIEIETFNDLPVEDHYVVPDFPQADFLITVRGDSMIPRYCSGDRVACRKIDHLSFIQWNKVYVINTRTNGLLIKRVNKSTKKDHYACVSDNPAYGNFDIPGSEVLWMAIVLGVIGLE